MIAKYSSRIVLLLGLVLLTACTIVEPEPPEVGLPNPASVYCSELGYREENRENEAGQYGVCIFPDGSECDSWDFLRGRCGIEFSYCVQQGHRLESDGNEATCFFEDGSSCRELAYFQGDCKPGENP